jgi:hypothetical protein
LEFGSSTSPATLSTPDTHLRHPVHLIHGGGLALRFLPARFPTVHHLARATVDNLTLPSVETNDPKILAKLTLDSPTIKVERIHDRPTFSKEIVAEYQM